MNCLQVEAITILENERSYANILLGEYGVPEVLFSVYTCGPYEVYSGSPFVVDV